VIEANAGSRKRWSALLPTRFGGLGAVEERTNISKRVRANALHLSKCMNADGGQAHPRNG
jgi:hypothetical protein